jgi:type IV secretion system protein TrbG
MTEALAKSALLAGVVAVTMALGLAARAEEPPAIVPVPAIVAPTATAPDVADQPVAPVTEASVEPAKPATIPPPALKSQPPGKAEGRRGRLAGTPGTKAVDLSERWARNPRAIVASGVEGRVLFVFGETAPTIICSVLHVCDIELEAGETVNDKPQLGDTVRWHVNPAVSGEGTAKITHIIVKPTEPGLDTNMVVATNRRTYHLHLFSAETGFVYAVAFSYPDTEDDKPWPAGVSPAAKPDGSRAGTETGEAGDVPTVALNRLDFHYRIERAAGDAPILPVRAFNDGQQTFIQMPDSMRAADAPAPVVIGPDGKSELVNYRFRHGYFVLDKLPLQIALISGVGGDQQRVVVTHDSCSDRRILNICLQRN